MAPPGPADTICVAHDLDIKCAELQQLGYLPLTVIAACGDVERARTLLGQRANPNERCQRDGSTPLMLAAHNKHLELVKLLLTNGADCTLTNQEGLNAFMMAVRSGDANIVNTMWPYGQKKLCLDHKDNHGNTVLHLAAKRKWDCCVHFLLTHGASPGSITKKGQTALMICAERGDQKTAARLIESGADMLCEDGSGYTAICLSFDDGKKEMTSFLLDRLPEDKREQYIKSRLDYLTDPPEYEEERDYTEEHIVPLLGQITSRPQYRNAFYNQRVISKILDKAKENIQNLNMMKVTSKLICEIIFYFSEEVDGKFVRQYIQCKGPDFTINTLKYYTEKMRLPEKETILYFLPMISITEVHEGSVWLSKNYLLVSEYTNFFKGTLAHCVHPPDYSGTYSKLLKRMEPIWQHFLKVVNELQSRNRERQMVQLLEEEEREKERQIKKREKKRNKRQEKQKKKDDIEQEQEPEITEAEIQPPAMEKEPVEQNAKEFGKHISETTTEIDIHEKSSKAKKKDKKIKKPKKHVENVETFMDFRDRLSPCDTVSLENQMSSLVSTHVGSWHTVQPKRQPNKEKEVAATETSDKDKTVSAIEKSETVITRQKDKKERNEKKEKINEKKEKKEKKTINISSRKVPVNEQKQRATAAHAVNSRMRWADVARGQKSQIQIANVQKVLAVENQKHGQEDVLKNKSPWNQGDAVLPGATKYSRNGDSKRKEKPIAKEPKQKMRHPKSGNDFGTLLEAELTLRSPLVLPSYTESLSEKKQGDPTAKQRHTAGSLTVTDAMSQMRDMLVSSKDNCGSLVSKLRNKLVEGKFATDEFDKFVEYYFPMADETLDSKTSVSASVELKTYTATDISDEMKYSKQLKPVVSHSRAHILKKDHSGHDKTVLECAIDKHQEEITATIDFCDIEQALTDPNYIVMFQEYQRMTVSSLEKDILLHRENDWFVPGLEDITFPLVETLLFKQYTKELIDNVHLEFRNMQACSDVDQNSAAANNMPVKRADDNPENREITNGTKLHEHIRANKKVVDSVVTSTKPKPHSLVMKESAGNIPNCKNNKILSNEHGLVFQVNQGMSTTCTETPVPLVSFKDPNGQKTAMPTENGVETILPCAKGGDNTKQNENVGLVGNIAAVPRTNEKQLCKKQQQKLDKDEHTMHEICTTITQKTVQSNVKRQEPVATRSHKYIPCDTLPTKSKDDKQSEHSGANMLSQNKITDDLKRHGKAQQPVLTGLHIPQPTEGNNEQTVHTQVNKKLQKGVHKNIKQQEYAVPKAKTKQTVPGVTKLLIRNEDKTTTKVHALCAHDTSSTYKPVPVEKCKRPKAPAVIMPKRLDPIRKKDIEHSDTGINQDENKADSNMQQEPGPTNNINNVLDVNPELKKKAAINVVHCIRPKRHLKPCTTQRQHVETSNQQNAVINVKEQREFQNFQHVGDSAVVAQDDYDEEDEEHTVFSDSSDEEGTVSSDDSEDESTLCSDHSDHENDSDETTRYSSDEQTVPNMNEDGNETVPCWYTNKEALNEEISWENAAAAFSRDNYRVDHPEETVSTTELPIDPAIIECGTIASLPTKISNTCSEDLISHLYTANIQTSITDSAAQLQDSSAGVSRLNTYTNVKKQTAVIKPMQNSEHSENCALGKSILTNASNLGGCDIVELRPTDIEGCLLGSADYKHNNNQSNGENWYFPSFHDETKLSAHCDPNAISTVHKMQQMQLMQLKRYHDAMKINMMAHMSVYRTDFPYYASCAGINQAMTMDWIQKQREQHNSTKPCDQTDNQLTLRQADVSHDTSQTAMHQFISHCPEQNDQLMRKQPMTINEAQEPDTPPVDNIIISLDEVKRENYIPKGRAVHVKPMPTYRYNAEETAQQTSTHNMQLPNTAMMTHNGQGIHQIAAATAAAMSEAYKAMTSTTIQSRRWQGKLAQMQQLPPHDLVLIGKILVPRHNQEQYVISHGNEPITLGFLADGTEVAVKLINCRSRALTSSDLQLLVDMNITENFVIQYKAFSCYQGFYYIATDLYEYRLDEYIQKLQTEGPYSGCDVNIERTVWQMFRGLAGLHQHRLMVHGELRPSNVVIDLKDNVKISGYGLGRKVNCGSVLAEFSDDDCCWLAPEILIHKQTDSFKSDINVAGMLTYYILSGGHNPYGGETDEIVWNISQHNFVMEYISEEAMHLLSLMLSFNKTDRPCISDAAKHPMFWGEELTARFVIIAGSDVLRDLKAGIPLTGNGGDTMIDILNAVPIASQLNNWISSIDPVVMNEMRAYRQYKNHFVELVLFVYNVCLHFDKMSDESREIIDEPCKYLQVRVPTMFMAVYRAVKASSRAERTCYKPFF